MSLNLPHHEDNHPVLGLLVGVLLQHLNQLVILLHLIDHLHNLLDSLVCREIVRSNSDLDRVGQELMSKPSDGFRPKNIKFKIYFFGLKLVFSCSGLSVELELIC